MNLGERISDIELRTGEGDRVMLARYLGRPTVVQLLRYYG